MSRELSVGAAAAIAAKVVRYAFFAEFAFASGTVRVWSGLGVKAWNGSDWTGAGDYGGVGPIEETMEVGATGLVFTLSGIPSSTLSLALGDHYRGKPCKLWLGFLNASDVVVNSYQLFAGRMDTMSIDDGAEVGQVAVQAESRLIDLKRPRTQRYTDAQQQRLFAGDLGCQYVAKLAEKPLYWGVPPSSRADAAALGAAQQFLEA